MQKQNRNTDLFQINKERLLKYLLDLCQIVGPSKKESGVADYICVSMHEKNSDSLMLHVFPPETIPEGGDTSNILIQVQGTGRGDVILLSAHMDTVPLPSNQERAVVLNDGILKTEGESVLGGDDRAGIAAALEMIDLGIEHTDQHAGIEILFTVQEELGCLGSRDIDPGVISSEYGYNLDGETPPGSIIIRAPQKAKYNCEVFGISSHAALASDKGLSAIKIAGRIVSDLPQGQVDSDTTANIGSISGGSQTNIVPDYVQINGEVRSFSVKGFKKVSTDVERICSTISTASGGRSDLAWEHAYYGYSLDPSSPCISRFTSACLKTGIKPEMLSSPGGGDSNNLNALGIENVVFGLGMHNIHTSEEHLVIDEFLTAVEILKEVVFF